MKNSILGFTLALSLVAIGCTPTSDQNLAGSQTRSGKSSGQAMEAEATATQPPAPEAAELTAPATTAASGDSTTSTPASGTPQNTTPKESSPGNDAQKNFEAGIVAYQVNNLSLAFQEFLMASKKGHADSQFNLALMFEQGIGVERDETRAVIWYDKAANQGNSAAQYNLAVLYENGRGTQVDFAEANKWYRRASVQGDPLAIGNLGMLYIRGDGVPVNKTAGLALLLVSATMDPSPDNLARRNIATTPDLSADMIAAAQKLAGELTTAENMLTPLDQFLEQ